MSQTARSTDSVYNELFADHEQQHRHPRDSKPERDKTAFRTFLFLHKYLQFTSPILFPSNHPHLCTTIAQNHFPCLLNRSDKSHFLKTLRILVTHLPHLRY
jgi:hypothetical protein